MTDQPKMIKFEPLIESLLAKRHEARTAKDWPEVVRLGNELFDKYGVRMHDDPDGTTWHRSRCDDG